MKRQEVLRTCAATGALLATLATTACNGLEVRVGGDSATSAPAPAPSPSASPSTRPDAAAPYTFDLKHNGDELRGTVVMENASKAIANLAITGKDESGTVPVVVACQDGTFTASSEIYKNPFTASASDSKRVCGSFNELPITDNSSAKDIVMASYVGVLFANVKTPHLGFHIPHF